MKATAYASVVTGDTDKYLMSSTTTFYLCLSSNSKQTCYMFPLWVKLSTKFSDAILFLWSQEQFLVGK
jgi:hypothetical protein